MPKPTIYLIAGSNGAGKTTFAIEFLRKRAARIRFLNADEIARGLSPLAPRRVALKGGRILLSEVKSCIARGESFALESTLSGKTYVTLLQTAQAKGYRVQLHYLRIATVTDAIERIAQRVLQGGHHVPTEDVKRRFGRSLRNLVENYLPIADEWVIWDNTSFPATNIASARTHTIFQVQRMLLP
jgi:predicted ABC-type ATPase